MKYLVRTLFSFSLLILNILNLNGFNILENKHTIWGQDSLHVSFSWKIKAQNSGWEQAAYRIIVADDEESIVNENGTCWDSGKINSRDQLFIRYSGNQLEYGKEYYWKVMVWENGNSEGKWSSHKRVHTPIRYPEDWRAQWITTDYQKDLPAPLFRRKFGLKQPEEILSTRLYICGIGYYEAYLNGEKIGDRVLEPAQTNYDDYAFYSVYDLSPEKLKNENALGIMLGNGWFNQRQVWGPEMAYGPPAVIAQLIINYQNGRADTIYTDETWKWKSGPIVSNNIYAGESYDANMETAGWNRSNLEETDWHHVKLASTYPPKLVEQQMEPIRRMGEIQTVRILEPESGTWVFDFGQNFAGWVRLKVEGEKGRKITLRFAEEIDSKQQIDPASTGVYATKVVQTDQYICKGSRAEIWEPRFTYHGFRYVEVTGLKSRPEPDLLTGIVVYSSMDYAGTFSCSEPAFNKLHDMALWSLKSNVHSVPTDCPHRERCGWTGDAHTLAPTLIMNFNARQFLIKYMYDMRSSARNVYKTEYFATHFLDRKIMLKPAGVPTMVVPGKRASGIASPDWGTAVTQIPWQLYLNYGDMDVLREFYPDMVIWVDYMAGLFPDGIVEHGLGDWCPPGGNNFIDCPIPLSSTAFHYLDLEILKNTASLLGYHTEASFYEQWLKKVKNVFNKEFFDAANNTYGSQTANALAIQLGLVPEHKKQDVAISLKNAIIYKTDGFIHSGIFGLGRIFPALAENGEEDIVWRVFTKKGENSFAYMWENFGATTLWEFLPVGNLMPAEQLNIRSHNHPMNAGYDEWFFKGIAGIRPDGEAAGFKRITFRPYLTSKLEHAEATHESPYGTIESKWKWENNCFTWDIDIPANSSGKVFLPKTDQLTSISVNGCIVSIAELESEIEYPGFWVLGHFKSGNYHVKAVM